MRRSELFVAKWGKLQSSVYFLEVPRAKLRLKDGNQKFRDIGKNGLLEIFQEIIDHLLSSFFGNSTVNKNLLFNMCK